MHSITRIFEKAAMRVDSSRELFSCLAITQSYADNKFRFCWEDPLCLFYLEKAAVKTVGRGGLWFMSNKDEVREIRVLLLLLMAEAWQDLLEPGEKAPG